MINFRLDTKGDLMVRWPRRDEAIITMGQTYVAHENSLPVEQRLREPDIALIQAALTQATAAVEASHHGEQKRAAAAEQYRQAIIEARTLLEEALIHLQSHYISNLAQLEAWGVDTRAGARGVTVRKPSTNKDWVNFLLTYVAREQSLAESDRITDPPLAALETLAQTIQNSLEDRRGGRDQREIGIKERATAVNHLLDLLRVAAAVLIVTRFHSQVMNDLQLWGYEVIARSGSKESGIPTPPASN